ncbi:YbaK/EbsC family protein [Pseudomonas sp. UL073]|uniref:YbaK/EbsC family protein n=1 Tax=Zestomonas insulae TaxID=2809017 RepID=A0ABS2IEC0_9GAMM|nr:YbaK/EbsC family protein [Pseudomonas insulae]MBM7061444.1 YbaK/EbsC family protein [Pseudomonas insulae]
MSLYDRNLALLDTQAIAYRLVEHEPVLDYPTAHAVRARFGLRGVESKSLFLRLKDGRYAMLVTAEGARADWPRLKTLLGARPSVASDAELIELTGCVPQCACPFGHAAEIELVFDDALLGHEHLLYSPGPPELTLEVATADLPRLLASLPNRVHHLHASAP